MKIAEILARRRPVFSFEFFPPKNEEGEEALRRALEDLRRLAPDFVTMTYGAGGSTRRKTVDWAARIQDDLRLPAAAHLTCVGHARDEIRSILDEIVARGIRNVMALRGDPPRGETAFRPHPDGFRYANELVAFIRSNGYDLCLGVAGYPETHPEAPSAEADIENLKRKVEAGGDFVTTQLFFDADLYARFVGRCRAAGIDAPILAGVMPVTNLSQVKRFTEMCGATIPPDLLRRLEEAEAAGGPAAVEEVGVAWAIDQCRRLLEAGAPGIHFYTLNRSTATRRILEALRRDLPPSGAS